MSSTDKIETETNKEISCNEPLPENLSFFLMSNANQHRVHLGKLTVYSVAAFAAFVYLGIALL